MNQEKNSHQVINQPKKIRFVDYVCGRFVQLPTRSSVKKAIKRGEILLNGKPAEEARYMNNGDRIEYIPTPGNPPKEYKLELDIIYDDPHLVIINKPAGIVVSGNRFKTIENALRWNITKSNEEDALSWAKPVHRLDAQTSGLLISARTAKTQALLGQLFEKHGIQKTYRAVVVGKPPKQDTIASKIKEQEAETSFKALQTVPALKYGNVSLVELYPKTGRTHQLRIHLSGIGHQIVGDKLHGEKGKTITHKGLFLAATGLEFQHPITGGKLDIKISHPSKFSSFMEREKRRYENHNLNKEQ